MSAIQTLSKVSPQKLSERLTSLIGGAITGMKRKGASVSTGRSQMTMKQTTVTLERALDALAGDGASAVAAGDSTGFRRIECLAVALEAVAKGGKESQAAPAPVAAVVSAEAQQVTSELAVIEAEIKAMPLGLDRDICQRRLDEAKARFKNAN